MEFLDTALNQLLVILGRVGPIEVIDVLAVAFILYQLLRLVKGTQATQLIVGLVMLGIIGVAATQLHLILLGCLLPLADESQVRERLGTRHRAAIGLSLASDALILVVSEETGAISVVENGQIDRSLDGDRLRQRLTGGLDTTGPASGGRQHIV